NELAQSFGRAIDAARLFDTDDPSTFDVAGEFTRPGQDVGLFRRGVGQSSQMIGSGLQFYSFPSAGIALEATPDRVQPLETQVEETQSAVASLQDRASSGCAMRVRRPIS